MKTDANTASRHPVNLQTTWKIFSYLPK